MNTIRFEIFVERIKHGLEYSGDIKFNGVRFFYRLVCKISVPLIGKKMGSEKWESVVDSCCDLTVRRSVDATDSIAVPKSIWQMTACIAAVNAWELYNKPASTQDLMGMFSRHRREGVNEGTSLVHAMLETAPSITASGSFEGNSDWTDFLG